MEDEAKRHLSNIRLKPVFKKSRMLAEAMPNRLHATVCVRMTFVVCVCGVSNECKRILYLLPVDACMPTRNVSCTFRIAFACVFVSKLFVNCAVLCVPHSCRISKTEQHEHCTLFCICMSSDFFPFQRNGTLPLILFCKERERINGELKRSFLFDPFLICPFYDIIALQATIVVVVVIVAVVVVASYIFQCLIRPLCARLQVF